MLGPHLADVFGRLGYLALVGLEQQPEAFQIVIGFVLALVAAPCARPVARGVG
jgi:cytochrome c biogenesis protein CcdA